MSKAGKPDHTLFTVDDDDELRPGAAAADASARSLFTGDDEPASAADQPLAADAERVAAPAPEEPLYTDDDGVPMLFDVVIPGEQLRAAGVTLVGQAELEQRFGPAAPPPSDDRLAAQIQQAIDAALPAATERAAAALRDSLLAEVQQRLEAEQAAAAGKPPHED